MNFDDPLLGIATTGPNAAPTSLVTTPGPCMPITQNLAAAAPVLSSGCVALRSSRMLKSEGALTPLQGVPVPLRPLQLTPRGVTGTTKHKDIPT